MHSKDVFEVGRKSNHGVSNDAKKNVFLIISYFLGPHELSAWTAAAAAFPFSLSSIKEIE